MYILSDCYQVCIFIIDGIYCNAIFKEITIIPSDIFPKECTFEHPLLDILYPDYHHPLPSIQSKEFLDCYLPQ